MRADLYLTENGIAASRQKAKNMITDGVVYADGKQVIKPSEELNCETIEIRGEIMPYVSRGGLKLQGAFEAFGLSPENMIALDVGASTGGFTDCLLQYGAKKVYAVDCGHSQLDKSLLNDERVISIENCNARFLNCDIIPEKCDICVMDVSFISQTLIHNAISDIIKSNGFFISLIKPQFESKRSDIGKNGIVKDEKIRQNAVNKVTESALASGFSLLSYKESPIKGGDGNIEYIALFKKCADKRNGEIYEKNSNHT